MSSSSYNSKNEHFERKNDSLRRHDVMLFGDAGFKKYLESIQAEIRSEAFNAQYQKQCIRAVEEMDDPEADKELQHAQAELKKANNAVEKLNTFYQNVSTHWATLESRVLGHVILSPPINVDGIDGYTEDWAVIEIDASKVDTSNFKGNAIDLGTRIEPSEFARMMHPNLKNCNSFRYPFQRLLRLKGTIPDKDIRCLPAHDQNNDPCLMVIKRGNTTGLTIGRANNIVSYARYYNDDKAKTSKEWANPWAILPFDSKSGVFSADGDSGSVIVDGLLTGGAERKSSGCDGPEGDPLCFLRAVTI